MDGGGDTVALKSDGPNGFLNITLLKLNQITSNIDMLSHIKLLIM